MDSNLHTTAQALIYLAAAIGLVGQVIPFFPGVTIIWLAVLAYGLLNGFTWTNGIVFALITLLMAAGNWVDNLLMGANTRQRGTSWLAVGLSMAAMLVFGLLWTPLGGLAASFAVIFLVEFLRLRDWRRALGSVRGMLTGCGWSVIARLGISLVMIALWLVWIFLL